MKLLLILIPLALACNNRPDTGNGIDSLEIKQAIDKAGGVGVYVDTTSGNTGYYADTSAGIKTEGVRISVSRGMGSTNYGEQSKKPLNKGTESVNAGMGLTTNRDYLTNSTYSYIEVDTTLWIRKPVVDTIPEKDSITAKEIYDFNKSLGNYTIDSTPKYDTVRVLLMMCDTTEIKNTTHIVAQVNGVDIGKGVNRIPYVYWQFGYEVTERREMKENYIYLIDKIVDGYERVHVEYLTADKKKLPKNIVIFQTLNIK